MKFESTMHHFFNYSFLAILLLAIGCQNKPESNDTSDSQPIKKLDAEDKLVGLWSVDAEASRLKWGDRQELARRMSVQLDMRWKYNADKSFTVYSGDRSRDGNWIVKSRDENTIDIDVSTGSGPQNKTVTFTFKFETSDRLIYSSSEAEGELVLIRADNAE